MKRGRILLLTLCVALLAGCGGEEERNYPPALSVNCGGKTVAVGAWSAYWEGGPEGSSFTACGDHPASDYAQEWLEIFESVPGELLTLAYGETPDELKVLYTPDHTEGSVRGEAVTLFEGNPETEELAFVLPENCAGIYETYASWERGEDGHGSTSCGFRIVDREREEALRKRSPPELFVACGEEEAAAWLGGYQWNWPEGGQRVSAIADVPHPLDVMNDLPAIHGAPGEELVLAVEGVPDKADVICYWVDGKDLTACPMGDLTSNSRLTLPENCAGTLWIVEGKWETGDSTGQAQYAFCIV